MKTTNIENLEQIENKRAALDAYAAAVQARLRTEADYRSACAEEMETVKRIIDESDDASIQAAIDELKTWRRYPASFNGVDAGMVRKIKGLWKPVASWLVEQQTGRTLPESPLLHQENKCY